MNSKEIEMDKETAKRFIWQAGDIKILKKKRPKDDIADKVRARLV